MTGASFGVSIRASLPEDKFDCQPLLSRGRFLFAADVRLDNRDELEAALQLDGRKLADSDVLFRAWLRWGEESLNRVVGDFAFALFDGVEKRLLLVRDATGERPLFYHHDERGMAFASMANALVTYQGRGTIFDMESLARAMTDLPPRDDRTFFRSIRKVTPAHILTIDGRGARSRNYWQPALYEGASIASTDYVAQYWATLRTAVEPRLRRAGGGVSAHLSAGLDSSAIAVAAAEILGGANLLALTAAPSAGAAAMRWGDRFPDESEPAAQTARQLNVRHVIVRQHGSAISHLRSQAALYQEPYRNHVNGGWLKQLAGVCRSEGCELTLTGEGGNLTLNGGSLAILGDFVEAGEWQRWLVEARLAWTSGGARWTGVMMNSFGSRLPKGAIDLLERKVRGTYSRVNETFVDLEATERFIRPEPPLRHRNQPPGSYSDRLAVIRSSDFGNYNAGFLAETGTELRHPLLDRRAIEFSLAVPPSELLRNGRSRSLARRALAGRVPQKILSMHERGYQAAGWHRHVSKGELFAMIEEIEASGTARELLDLKKLKTTVEHWDRIDFDDPARNLAITTFLPLALAGGLFILEAERGFPSLAQPPAVAAK